MIWQKIRLGALLVSTFCAIAPAQAFASQDRAEVEARVRADVAQDLSEELQFGEWVNPISRYCGVCHT